MTKIVLFQLSQSGSEFPHMLAEGHSFHSFKDDAAEAMSVAWPNSLHRSFL